MQELTPERQQAVADLARRYAVSAGVVRALLDAVAAGGGSAARFDDPELGGAGQWTRDGGAVLVDGPNPPLQTTVSALCAELAGLVVAKLPAPSEGRLGAAPASETTPASIGSMRAALQPPYARSITQPSMQAATAPVSTRGVWQPRDVLDALERLGNLHKQGVVSDDEFRAKKADLLSRL